MVRALVVLDPRLERLDARERPDIIDPSERQRSWGRPPKPSARSSEAVDGTLGQPAVLGADGGHVEIAAEDGGHVAPGTDLEDTAEEVVLVPGQLAPAPWPLRHRPVQSGFGEPARGMSVDDPDRAKLCFDDEFDRPPRIGEFVQGPRVPLKDGQPRAARPGSVGVEGVLRKLLGKSGHRQLVALSAALLQRDDVWIGPSDGGHDPAWPFPAVLNVEGHDSQRCLVAVEFTRRVHDELARSDDVRGGQEETRRTVPPQATDPEDDGTEQDRDHKDSGHRCLGHRDEGRPVVATNRHDPGADNERPPTVDHVAKSVTPLLGHSPVNTSTPGAIPTPGNLAPLVTVSEIHIYPVKSMRGVSLAEAIVEPRGLQHDRRWLVVDDTGRFVSQREDGRMAQLVATVSPQGLRLSTPDGSDVVVPHRDGESVAAQTSPVQIWRDTVDACDCGPEAATLLSEFFGAPYRLVSMPESTHRQCSLDHARPGDHVSFADGFPLLLANESSMTDLNGRLDRSLPINRFRANIVVSGAAPWDEDGWQTVTIGDVSFRNVKPCGRCIVTTTDQETGERHSDEPLRTLTQVRLFGNSANFGVNLVPNDTGVIRVGDTVRAT